MKAHIHEPMGDYVPLEVLRTLVSKFEDKPDDMPITFEFLCASLFPTIYDSVQKAINESYTQGYIQGKSEVNESEVCS